MKKRLVATVTSDIQDKTVVVSLTTDRTHPIYMKRYKVSQKFHAHDETNQASVGDIVEIEETSPISKRKSWTVKKVVSKAQG